MSGSDANSSARSLNSSSILILKSNLSVDAKPRGNSGTIRAPFNFANICSRSIFATCLLSVNEALTAAGLAGPGSPEYACDGCDACDDGCFARPIVPRSASADGRLVADAGNDRLNVITTPGSSPFTFGFLCNCCNNNFAFEAILLLYIP